MNSKQRKQAERLAKDMEFMLPLKVQQFNASKAALKSEREAFEIWVEEAKKEIGQLRLNAEADIKKKHAENSKEIADEWTRIAEEKIILGNRAEVLRRTGAQAEAGLDALVNGKILGDVLLQLELDAEPAKIAHELRVRFGLAIPEW